jgi:hypothetical protein
VGAEKVEGAAALCCCAAAGAPSPYPPCCCCCCCCCDAAAAAAGGAPKNNVAAVANGCCCCCGAAAAPNPKTLTFQLTIEPQLSPPFVSPKYPMFINHITASWPAHLSSMIDTHPPLSSLRWTLTYVILCTGTCTTFVMKTATVLTMCVRRSP